MTGRRPTIVLLVALLSTGCAANEATPAPTTSPNPSPSPSAVGTPLAIPTATPTPVPTASPTAVPIGDWKEVPAQPSVKGAQFQDVAWTGLRFVAVGVAMSGGGVFLDSTNGSTWNRQSDLNANAHPTRLAAGPGGVVAVGAIGERPASWFSTDGVAWTPRRDAFPMPDVGDDTVTVTDVVARGNGWLAVGRQDPFCQIDCGTTARRGLAWTSSNGSEWTLIPGQAAFKGAGLNAVTRRADEFAAVGGAGGHAVILTSPDGLKWSRVPDDPMFGSRASGDGPPVAATAVAWDDGALVVLGMVQSEAHRVRAWWSADGRTWARAEVDKAVDGQVFSATTTPIGFHATGPSGGDGCRGGIWSSTDGRAWRCEATVAAFEGFGPYAAAANDDVIVAVGLTSAGVDDDASDGLPGAAWFRTLR